MVAINKINNGDNTTSDLELLQLQFQQLVTSILE